MAQSIQFKKGNEDAYANQWYDVGDIFITLNATNPASRFGGTWELLCPGRTIVCVSTTDDEFSTVKKTGGSKTHGHQYGIQYSSLYGLPYGTDNRTIRTYNGANGTWSTLSGNGTTSEQGNNGVQERYGSTFTCAQYQSINNTTTSSNLMPYMAVYMWVRTA